MNSNAESINAHEEQLDIKMGKIKKLEILWEAVSFWKSQWKGHVVILVMVAWRPFGAQDKIEAPTWIRSTATGDTRHCAIVFLGCPIVVRMTVSPNP